MIIIFTKECSLFVSSSHDLIVVIYFKDITSVGSLYYFSFLKVYNVVYVKTNHRLYVLIIHNTFSMI